jgi:trk system potassium uptake protein TrkA
MNIVLVGMGAAGKHIAETLVKEGHDLVVIDQDETSLEHAEESLDAMVLHGHGASPVTLRQAGADRADLFVAVTNHDEVNMLAAIQAKRMGAAKVIARVSNEIYFEHDRGLYSDMFGLIDLVINPEILVALEMHKLVRSAGAVAVEDFANNRVEMEHLLVDADSAALNRSLKDLRLPENTLIAALVRDDQLIIPSGNDVILPGDEVLAVGRIEQMPALEKIFKRERKRYTQKVVIIGGSRIGEHLARALSADGIKVTFIDKRYENCVHLAEELGEGVTILHGDGTDVHLLEEERVGSAHVFVSCSAADEVNLMAALLAKDLGVQRAIALVHKPDYATVCERLGVDVSLSPRLAVARQVLKYVREGQIIGIRPVWRGGVSF